MMAPCALIHGAAQIAAFRTREARDTLDLYRERPGQGWIKEIALQRRARHRGKDRVGWQFTLAAAAYNLIRLPKLLTT